MDSYSSTTSPYFLKVFPWLFFINVVAKMSILSHYYSTYRYQNHKIWRLQIRMILN
jgi:hypothetical protein